MEDQGISGLEQQLREQKVLLEENQALMKSLRRSARFNNVMAAFRFFLILVPIIVALIYLPPFLKESRAIIDGMASGNLPSNGLPQGFQLQDLQRLIQQAP